MPKSVVEEITEDGIVRRCGTLQPDEYPVAMSARDSGMGVFTESEITNLLSQIQQGRGFHSSREIFDGSWILDQQQTSGCNGNSTAGALSRQLYNSSGQKIILSGGDAYSQMNGGHDRGSVLADGMKVVVNGIAPITAVPNTTIYSSDISSSAKALRKNYCGFEPLGLDSELELATFVLVYKVAIVCVQAGGSFSRQDSNGLCLGGNGPGNHSVGIDDIRLFNGVLEFDMFNSWSADWGRKGRTWLRYDDHLKQSIKVHRFWGLPQTRIVPKTAPPTPK